MYLLIQPLALLPLLFHSSLRLIVDIVQTIKISHAAYDSALNTQFFRKIEIRFHFPVLYKSIWDDHVVSGVEMALGLS